MNRDRMQRQRFELKFMLDEEKAAGISDFLRAHLEIDENGVGKPNFSYPVHSLYVDSDKLATFWATINGDKNRFKLRLRFYNDHPDSPVFFEIKRRMNNCILKQRGGVRKDAVPWLLAGHLPEPGQLIRNDAKSWLAIKQFVQLSKEMHAAPKAHVAYLREAYIDAVNDNVRVTLDRNVLTEVRTEPSFATTLTHPSRPFGDKVILELKFTDRYPEWLRRLVERFGLTQCGAAKYAEGVAGLPPFGLAHVGNFPERAVNETGVILRPEPGAADASSLLVPG